MVIYCVCHEKMIQQSVRSTYRLLFCLIMIQQSVPILFDQYSETQRGQKHSMVEIVHICACVCVCVCVHACVCVRAHVCVCVLDRKESRVVTSRALVIAQTATYLTSYSDCLTGFCEPLSPHYRCHTGLKNV